MRHGLDGRALIPAAEGHEHRTGSDGGVEPLGKAAAGADVQIGGKRQHTGPEVRRHSLFKGFRCFGRDLGVLLRAVGAEERPRQIDDHATVPAHAQPRRFGDARDQRGLEVLLPGEAAEGLRVLRRDDDGHALLGFRDGELRAVESVVFARDRVQIHVQPVRELADGHADAAGSEVVAALDEPRGVRIAEEPLQLALLGRVALLHLGAAGVERRERVRLGGARGTAAAVAPRAPAEQDHRVAGQRLLASDVFRRDRRDDRADLQMLGRVAGVVELVHLPGGQADLVAVGGIAGGRRRDELSLRQLAGQRPVGRLQGVGRAGDAHGGVDVRPPGERVADGAADAGGRAAEGLDLRGVVVRFIFEQEQPRLRAGIRLHGDFYGAGVHFLRLVEPGKPPLGFEHLRRERGDVHEIDGLRPVQLRPRGKIALVGALQQRVAERHAVDGCEERRVAAVVGPVGVDHAQLRHGRVAALGLKIVPAEAQIVRVHRKPHFRAVRGELVLPERGEAGQGFDGLRAAGVQGERLRLLHRGEPALHRVEHAAAHRLQICGRHVASEQIDLRGAHRGALLLAQKLNALGGGVCPLVELAGQILHGESRPASHVRRLAAQVELRLGEDRPAGVLEKRPVDVFHIVAVENAQRLHGAHAEKVAQLAQKRGCLRVEAGLFFHKYAIDHSKLTFRPAGPARRCRGGNTRSQNARARPADTPCPRPAAASEPWKPRPARARRRSAAFRRLFWRRR